MSVKKSNRQSYQHGKMTEGKTALILTGPASYWASYPQKSWFLWNKYIGIVNGIRARLTMGYESAKYQENIKFIFYILHKKEYHSYLDRE